MALHLTYCLNVHPGESWAENFAAIRQHALRVKAKVSPRQPFGLGLRLSNAATRTLVKPVQLAKFREFLAEHDLYVFTVNGFPYGTFHGRPVKERVYRPDWRTDERVAYTNRIADILAALLPDGVAGSISTVPGSYKPWITGKRDVQAMVRNLNRCAEHLARLRERTGKLITLGLEPEPDCFLETTEEVVRFFEMLPAGEHLGICFDTCHLAVQFEDLRTSLRRLKAAGVLISKVQISAALATNDAKRLNRFQDDVYLHQTRWHGKEIRSHFHVPLYWKGTGVLRSTADQLTPAFFADAAKLCRHFEIETYTFNVLPAALRRGGVDASIAREFAFVRSRFRSRRTGLWAGVACCSV
jgi:sugar phosphate isomerase/epimerase